MIYSCIHMATVGVKGLTCRTSDVPVTSVKYDKDTAYFPE